MGVDGAFSPVGYTITPGEWASDSSIVVNSRENRRNIIRLIEQSNGASINQILEDVRRGKIDVYNVSRTFVASIRGKFAPNTVRVYRAYLPDSSSRYCPNRRSLGRSLIGCVRARQHMLPT